jgi:hypothetical protein
MCDEDSLGFKGAIRELIAVEAFIQPGQQLFQHSIISYQGDIKGYYRFIERQGFLPERQDVFLSDYFKGKDTQAQLRCANQKCVDYIGHDRIPNNICPQTVESKEFAYFSGP